MTHLTQLPQTPMLAVDNVVAIKLALMISAIGRPRSDTAIGELYEDLRNEVQKRLYLPLQLASRKRQSAD